MPDLANASQPQEAAAAPVWTNRLTQLPEGLAYPQAATPLPEVSLLHWNEALAKQLHWPASDSPEVLAGYFSGNTPLPGSAPRATVYSGHQFGVYVPQLGDGRALWLGELLGKDGEHYELQLKGSGQTPFSRMGDGRAVLRSSVREYLASHAMQALGIPTTEALALVGSPEPVYRETVETAAVVTRVAPSFLRFGHFEFFHHTGQPAMVKALADFVITHYEAYYQTPLSHLPDSERYGAWFKQVCATTALMLAHWQSVGFCHGVMNTDNFSILGLTIDYGPYGFMDAFNPGHICNHSDYSGRYAFFQQPRIAQWNLAQLAIALSGLLSEDQVSAGLETYKKVFYDHFRMLHLAKLGLKPTNNEEADEQLLKALLTWMAERQVDFTGFFRSLAMLGDDCASNAAPQKAWLHSLALPEDLPAPEWLSLYQQAIEKQREITGITEAERQQAIRRVNPVYVLRNYIAQEVIEATQQGDTTLLAEVFSLLGKPFTALPADHPLSRYAESPPAWAGELCVSCSS